MAKREGGDKEAPLAFPSSLSFLGSLWNTTSTWHPPRGNLILKWWNKMLICFQMSLPINVCLLLEWKIEKHDGKRGRERERLSNSLQTTRQSSQIRLPIHCSITATTASLENDIDRKFFDIRSFFSAIRVRGAGGGQRCWLAGGQSLGRKLAAKAVHT